MTLEQVFNEIESKDVTLKWTAKNNEIYSLVISKKELKENHVTKTPMIVMYFDEAYQKMPFTLNAGFITIESRYVQSIEKLDSKIIIISNGETFKFDIDN